MTPWKITWNGLTWTDKDVKGYQLALVAEQLDGSWTSLDPWRGPRELMTWLAVLLAPAHGLDAALAYVYTLDVADIIGCLSEPDDPPTAPVPVSAGPKVTPPAVTSKRTTPKRGKATGGAPISGGVGA